MLRARRVATDSDRGNSTIAGLDHHHQALAGIKASDGLVELREVSSLGLSDPEDTHPWTESCLEGGTRRNDLIDLDEKPRIPRVG